MKCTDLFRYPKTTGEMRQFFAASCNDRGVKVKVRGRRSPKQLPNAWDDIWRSEFKNWKYYRKNQWRD